MTRKKPGQQSEGAALRAFSRRLVAWHRRHGRHDLPWQRTRDAYRIWVSEIMLQQTQVGTVISYYERFLDRFPDVASLAAAPLEEVLRLWAGLGYYSRARNLHRAAVAVVAQHGGAFPQAREALQALPGIGRSTAAAVAAFAFGAREAILDGNVKRVLARHFALLGDPGQKSVENRYWEIAESLLPVKDIAVYTQAIMDVGATVCTRTAPKCPSCPVRPSCAALALNQVLAFPERKPRRRPPVRRVAMLLIMHAGRVLLERRPPTGIWGGLWSLPEMPVDGDVAAHCANRYASEVSRVGALSPLRHAFTHFTLDIIPYRCEVGRLRDRVASSGTKWFAPEAALDAGIPVPIAKILRQLRG